MNLPTLLVTGAVRGYQYTLRPVLGGNCRFWPSCSDYAVEALRTHGAARGSWMAARRVLRCNPWHPGGIDPVPPAAPDGCRHIDLRQHDRSQDGT